MTPRGTRGHRHGAAPSQAARGAGPHPVRSREGLRRGVGRWLLVPAAAAVMAGCGSGHRGSAPTTAPRTSPSTTGVGGPTTPAPTSTTSPGPTTTSPATTGTAPATSAGTGGTGPIGECTTGQLRATLGTPNGTAGTIYYPLELSDTGNAPCFVVGYPGVSFVAGSDGHQVGAAARRVAASTPRVVIQPGGQAAATLGVVDPSAFGPSCSLTPVRGLRVYPPDQRAALYVPHPLRACANPRDVTLTIRPFGAGAG